MLSIHFYYSNDGLRLESGIQETQHGEDEILSVSPKSSTLFEN